MSDDEIAEALENPEDLDEETRKKLEGVLGDSGGDSDEDDETSASDDQTEASSDDDETSSEDDGGSSADGGNESEDDEESLSEGADSGSLDDDDPSEADQEDGSSETSDEPRRQFSEEELARRRQHAVGAIFDPDDAAGGEGDREGLDDPHLDEGDLDGDEGSNSSIMMIGLVAVLLFAGAAVGIVQFTKQGERIVHLFKGDLKEYERAKAQREKEEFERKQLEGFPKFGTLAMRGRPKYSTVKLDGEVQYGKTPESGEWKPVRLTSNTTFRDLDVEKDHTVSVSAPNHKPVEWTLTEGWWQQVGDSTIEHEKKLMVNLIPESPEKQYEFHQRLQTNADNEFYGEITINTEPKGAKIIFDGKPLLDEEGEQRTTPVTFEKAYYENEESGEIEEKKVQVDMPPDRGHKIQLRMPDNDDYPKYVTPVERQMWTCDWKDGEVPEEPPYPKHCDYSYKLDLNFDELKSYIEEREKEQKQVKKRNEELEAAKKEINKKTGG